MPLGDQGERRDRGLQALVGREQSEGGQQPPALEPLQRRHHLRAHDAAAPRRRRSVRDVHDAVRRGYAGVDGQPARCLGEHRHRRGVAAQPVQAAGLGVARFGEHRVQGDQIGNAEPVQLGGEVGDPGAVRAAEDPVLMLDDDRAGSGGGDPARRLAVVVTLVLADHRPHHCGVGQSVPVQRADLHVDVRGGIGERGRQVARIRGDAAPSRRIRGNDREFDTHVRDSPCHDLSYLSPPSLNTTEPASYSNRTQYA